ncbi:alkanesulfonate monooxygenase SsuD/methylene tetrahydromethanopterin reductase-like flavin-dependent oxidoreductase (luciferase family) [Microbacterium terrae]|uniref:Monooxygenase MoxC n=1 Tax=Microbacterium terrae TaxID=69369 RepID=A0A0M2HF97_9MICO|nr:LLM class flavin-dependent oxidoreductase [Microbacterium terrae]KJL45323.1 putative monooxygenase MoxC [Microbacterium terrae]MBP1078429.1 alkanesulfonate monooxygenase SsuD/methylene tetrahydromethanopterin reductase-like flavin-dependent oxidoreductase (luciferase family) [Microbacterium terrae]GLJ99329.1 hypothetical protein GCM10017594_25270 [Microbacterium terrae]
MSAALIALEGTVLADAVAQEPQTTSLLREGVRDGRLAAVVLGAPYAPRDHDPVAVATALTVHLPGIGVIAAADRDGDHPYNAARRLLSLDHLSGGRAGALFSGGGAADEASHTAERIEVVRKLWNSWPVETLLVDHATRRYARTDGIRAIAHAGDRYEVRGALNTPTSRQGEPVSLWWVDTPDELEASFGLVDLVVTDSEHVMTAWSIAASAERPRLVSTVPGAAGISLVRVRTRDGLARALDSASPAVPARTLRKRLGLPERRYDLSHAPLAFGAAHA